MKKKKLNIKKIILYIIILVLFVYAINICVDLLKNPTNTIIVEQGKIFKEESLLGYVIRDEVIVKGNNTTNEIVQIKYEGEKVAKNDAIFRYSSPREEEINNKIRELDLQIQEALKNETTIFSSDIKLLDNKIEETLGNMNKLNDMQELNVYKKKVSSYITKKANITGELSTSQVYIKGLVEQRNDYEKQLESASENVKAPKSGLVSYRVDGLEDVLKVGDFSYVNTQFLEDLKLKTGQIVATSITSGKVIDNFNCYIACSTNSEEAKNVKMGETIKLRLPNLEEIKAEIVYKLEEENNVVLIFKVNSYVYELINYRKVSFDIIWWSSSGLVVPKNAILYENNFAYVIRKRAGYEEKILIKILEQNEDYAIIDNYSTADLQELGYDVNSLNIKKSITLYDEIKINLN